MSDLSPGGALPLAAAKPQPTPPTVAPAPASPAAQPASWFKEKVAQSRAAGYSWEEIGRHIGDKITASKQAGYTDQEISTYLGAKDPAELQEMLKPLLGQVASPNFDENGWGRDLRQQYAKAVTAGHVQDGEGFLSRIGHEIAYGEGPTSWLYRGIVGPMRSVGLLAEAAGEVALPFAGMAPGSLGPAGAVAGPVASVLGRAAKTIGQLSKGLPSAQDFLDGAVALQQSSGKVVEGRTATVEHNLAQHWAETGEHPALVVEQAQHDPQLRSSLMSPQPPPAPHGSSITSTRQDGQFVIPREPGHVFNSPQEVPKSLLDTFYKLEGSGPSAVSPKGAIGRGQIMPSTAKGYGFDPQLLHDPAYNETVTRTILADLSRKYQGDTDAMAVAYNAGPGVADKWIDGGRNVTTLPEETQRYLARLHQSHMGEPAATVDLSKYAVGNAARGGPSDTLGVHPEFARRIDSMVKDMPPEIRDKFAITSGVRSAEREAQVYAEQHPGQRVPRDSYHSHGMAVDTTTNPEVLAWINANGGRYGVGYTIKHLPGEANHLEPIEGGARVPPEQIDRWAGGAPPHEPPRPPGEPPEEGGDPLKAMLGRIDHSKPSVFDIVADGWNRFYREMFRGDHPLVQLQDAIERGTPLADADNPRFLRRLAETDTTAKYAIERGIYGPEGQVAPGLTSILPKGKDYDEFKGYSIARWAVEKAEQAKETGVDVEKAKQVVALLHDKHAARFDDLMAFQNGSLGWLHDAGIIGKEDFDRMVAENKSYIPGYRAIEDEATTVPQASRTVYNPVRRFFGSDKKIDDPFVSILQNTFARAQLANKANADRALADAAEKVGLAGKTPARTFKFDLTDEEIAKLGVTAGDEDAASVFRRLSPGLRNDEVPIFRDGKMEPWKFADPDVVKVLRGMDGQQLAQWQRLMVPMTRFFRGATVLNPLFPVRLLTYDVPWQFITKPGLRNTVADVLVGMREYATDSAMYDRALASGTAERVFGGLEKDAYIRDILRGREDPSFTDTVYNVINSPLKAARAWSSFVTQGQRVGRFVRGVEAGESDLRAGVAASEAAFHRAGFGGPVGKNLNTLHPFALAQYNGLEQTFRAQFGVGKTILGEAYKPLEFTAKAAALVTVPMLTNWYVNRNEEWYKAAQSWQKNSGLLFHVGDVTMYLPLPPLLGFIYGGLPRMFAEAYADENPNAFDHLAGDLAMSFLPPGFRMTASIAEPIVEHVANYSFFKGRPLASDRERENLPPEQGGQWSSGAARSLSQFASDMPLLHGMNLSPQAIDNYIQGWGGTLGTAAIRAADLALGTGPHRGNAPATTVADWPLVSSWMARYPSAAAQPIQDFFDTVAGFRQVQTSIMTAASHGDTDRVKQLVKEHSGAGVMLLSHPDTMTKIGIASQTPEAISTFQNVFAQAVGSLTPARQQDVQSVYEAEAAMRQQRALVAQVQAASAEKMTPLDKRQLLDRYYAGMQMTAEHALPAMRRLGMGR